METIKEYLERTGMRPYELAAQCYEPKLSKQNLNYRIKNDWLIKWNKAEAKMEFYNPKDPYDLPSASHEVKNEV